MFECGRDARGTWYMFETATYLVSGVIFGLAAGISPGPLLTLVISETIRHSKKEGIIIASAPAVTDVPIILVALLVLSRLSSSDLILGVISILGALFIGYLAYESMKVKGLDFDPTDAKAESLKKGIIANLLNPHPYVFWLTIGAPQMISAYEVNLIAPVLFISGFYVFLIGSKIMVALIVDKSKSFLKSKAYLYIIRGLGIILLIFALLFIKEGLKYFGVIGS